MVAPKNFPARALLITCVSVVLLTSIVAQQTAIGFGDDNLWVGSWSCSPVSPLTQAPPLPPGMKPPEGDSLFTIPPPVTNATVRMIVRGTAGGDKVRIRVSNFYGKTPLRVGAAHIALREAGSGIKAGTDRALTFGGQPSIAVSPGAIALSDSVALSAPPNADIAVSLFFPEASPEKRTVHFDSVEEAYILFDKALQDPAHPTRLKPEYDSGDHLHPNDAGEKAMGASIDLSRFK